VTRRVLVLGLLVAFAAGAVVAANALRGPRHDGPLKTNSSVNIKFPLADDEIFIWGMDLPWDGGPAVGDISIDSIEPLGTHGLEVLGVVLTNSVPQPDGTCLSYGDRTAARFPPPDAATREANGAVLSTAAGKTCANHPSVLVGVRRLSNAAAGRIDALRMLYRQNGITYELVMPYSLDVYGGQVDAQGRRIPCAVIPTSAP
jgi:hypothetical protein